MPDFIAEIENYLSAAILSDFPDLDLETVDEGNLGVRFVNTYDYDQEKKSWKLGVDAVVEDDSPKWLKPLLNMSLTQIDYALTDHPMEVLKYFQQDYVAPPPVNRGDVYLTVLIVDRAFMFHLPIATALHLLPEEVLKKLKAHPKHYWCREAMSEMNIRERYKRQ
jgi:hypothetical protein